TFFNDIPPACSYTFFYPMRCSINYCAYFLETIYIKLILQFPLLRFSFRIALSIKTLSNITKVNVRDAISIKTLSNITKVNVRDALSIKTLSNITKVNVRDAISSHFQTV